MTKNSSNEEAVEYYRAKDGRTVAIYIDSSFDSYENFRPHLESEEERQHLTEAYDLEDIEQERKAKAHITDDEYPLQLVLLNRPEGSHTKAHYHELIDQPELPTRHQIFICQSGVAEVGIFTTEGDELGTCRLQQGDLVLLAEGHSVEFVEAGTKLIEIKQGPFPETDEEDKVDLDID